MYLNNIIELKTITRRDSVELDAKVNELIPKGWIILNTGTSKQGSASYDSFLYQWGK